MVEDLARRVVAVRAGRVRVVVDGYTASGKTSLANELAVAVRGLGRPTLRATFDDFKKPWRDAQEKGYDRVSGEGYYRNAPDLASARRLLLEPAGPDGSGVVALRRGIARDAAMDGPEEAERLHRDRYRAAEAIYVAEVDPRGRADVVVDNTDVARPVVVHR